jgi:hypothetical protein
MGTKTAPLSKRDAALEPHDATRECALSSVPAVNFV